MESHFHNHLLKYLIKCYTYFFGENFMQNSHFPVLLSEQEKEILIKLSNGNHTKKNLSERSLIILNANNGVNNSDIGRNLKINRNTVKKWRKRWFEASAEISSIKQENTNKLKKIIINTLSDSYRSGCKKHFTEEQILSIINLSLQTPESEGVPFSHWTNSSLRKCAIRLNIVESISVAQIGRFLKNKRHKSS